MIYNPLDKFYKSITGAVPSKTEITFRVKGNFDSVIFAFKKDGEDRFNFYSMTKADNFFEISFEFDKGLYFYFFKISDNKFISQNQMIFGEVMSNIIPFELTVYKEDFTCPDWFKGGIMYQIFPDRFNIGQKNKNVGNGKILHENWDDEPIILPNENGKILNNDFFGGDLKGIKDKLEYLSELGVTAIYLNPIFKAFSNHRYDTGDYFSIDSLLGCERDLVDLIEKAKEFDIKIILDGVFNHTGDDSVYFNKYGNYNSLGAYQSKESPYYDWFDFIDYPNEYDSWWGVKTLPAINEKCESFVEFIAGENGVIDHYTKLGLGGWRLDVVDELPSSFVKRIRNSIKKSNENAIVIGEVWEDASNKISYGKRREYFQGEELDSVMNYPLKNAIIDFVNSGKSENLVSVIRTQIDHYPQKVLSSLMNILSTHDTARIINALSSVDYKNITKSKLSTIKLTDLAGYNKVIFKVKLATILQYTLYGVPCIYYGDEIGLEGWFDPQNRRTFPWGKEDCELLDFFKKIGEIRRSYSAFIEGNVEIVYYNEGVLIFKRKDNESEVLITVNAGKGKYEIDFDGEMESLLDGKRYKGNYQITEFSFSILIKP